MRISLSWPDKRLSPNARIHRRAKAPITAKARKDAAWATIDAGSRSWSLPFVGERLPLRITFHPPDRRRRDDDNMIGAFKAARDGIADALGVDDRCFAPAYVFAEQVKGGMIVVEIGG